MNTQDEIKDLSNRLYYCSDTAAGRKMRRWIEKKIKQLEREESANNRRKEK